MSATFDHDRLLELAEALVDERIGDEQFAELDQLLGENAEARRVYHVFVATHQAITYSQAEEIEALLVDRADLPPSIVVRATGETDIDSTSRWERAYDSIYGVVSNYVALSLLVSSIVMAILLLSMGLIVPDVQPSNRGPLLDFVAEVTNTRQVTWGDASAVNRKSRSIMVGDRLILKSGLAEITYNNGARVVLEGPAQYEVSGGKSGYLYVGSLVARIENEEAKFFTVRTPAATVIDLGTEFGVEVSPLGKSSLVVFEGTVEVESAAVEGGMRLTAGQGATITDTKISRVGDAAVKHRFRRSILQPATFGDSIVLTIDDSQTGAPSFSTTKIGPLNDSFSYDSKTPLSDLPNQNYEADAASIWHSTFDKPNTAYAVKFDGEYDSLFVDFYARIDDVTSHDRDDNLTVEFYNGSWDSGDLQHTETNWQIDNTNTTTNRLTIPAGIEADRLRIFSNVANWSIAELRVVGQKTPGAQKPSR